MAYSHDHHDGQSHTHNHVHEAAEEGHGHDHAAAEDVSFTGGLQEQRYSQAKERATLEQTNLAEAKANQRCVDFSVVCTPACCRRNMIACVGRAQGLEPFSGYALSANSPFSLWICPRGSRF